MVSLYFKFPFILNHNRGSGNEYISNETAENLTEDELEALEDDQTRFVCYHRLNVFNRLTYLFLKLHSEVVHVHLDANGNFGSPMALERFGSPTALGRFGSPTAFEGVGSSGTHLGPRSPPLFDSPFPIPNSFDFDDGIEPRPSSEEGLNTSMTVAFLNLLKLNIFSCIDFIHDF